MQLQGIGLVALAAIMLIWRPVFAETPVNYNGSPLYLGDPDVYVHGDYVYLTGTADKPKSTVCSFNKEICIFRTDNLSSSTNSDDWELRYKYNPSLKDPLHDYCSVWAPDLAFNYFSSHWELRFTARQVPKGGSCVNETAQSIFMTTEALGAPTLYRDGQTSGPRAWKTGNGCPPSKTTPPPITANIDCMRLDDGYYDGYIPYVWYAGNPYYSWTLTGGNAIAITSLNSSAPPQRAVDQICTASRCFNYEEGVIVWISRITQAVH